MVDNLHALLKLGTLQFMEVTTGKAAHIRFCEQFKRDTSVQLYKKNMQYSFSTGLNTCVMSLNFEACKLVEGNKIQSTNKT